jgi:ABC-type transporter lipoprotein component MlaA
MTRFSVHTAETLLEVAELHWRAASRAAQTAQDEYDTARRMYASARSASVAANDSIPHHAEAAAADAGA